MTDYRIPFNRPYRSYLETEYVARSLRSGRIAGDGPFTSQCRQCIEESLAVCAVLLTTSCTHALEMSALLLDIAPGDEVIVPSFTFVSTINAFVLQGARPVFIDVRADTLNLDERLIEAAITPRTKTIVPVHYAGIGCEMDAITSIADDHGLAVVEDNAHGLFARYKGQYLGTFGCLATQSFHETKNFSCGEGGALLVNDPRLIERAEIIREKGTNRNMFFRGQVDKYTWVDVGSSYLSSDILAAVLLSQLEERMHIQKRRQQIWETYNRTLLPWAEHVGARLPFVPEHVDQAYHMFYLIMPTRESRDGLIAHLKKYGILSVFHYLPLHLSGKGRQFGGKRGDCPITETVSERLVRLPFYTGLSDKDLASVIEHVRAFQVDGLTVPMIESTSNDRVLAL